MRKRGFFIFHILLVSMLISLALWLQAGPKKKAEVLFPRREYVKERSREFFKKVDLGHPVLSKVDFFTRSEAYLSAYLNLTVFLVKNNDLQQKLLAFGKDNHLSNEAFNKTRQKLEIENYPQVQAELKFSDLTFYWSVLWVLASDYQNNTLSGNEAFKLWNIMLSITESVYKKGKKTAEHAAILDVSSHFIFFKQHKRWQKKAAKILKKIKN